MALNTQYATAAQLNTYATAELNTQYATAAQLNTYATAELNTQYATAAQLNTLSHHRTEHTIRHSSTT